ncbi:hypothetical protein CULC0102_1267 [Corynebacterium ulcerans 0102]|nr:hypothetical protein CULC0102_1267 [Corynebacterium ulcerans 0102]
MGAFWPLVFARILPARILILGYFLRFLQLMQPTLKASTCRNGKPQVKETLMKIHGDRGIGLV